MNIQGYLCTTLALAGLVFVMHLLIRLSPARGGTRRPWGKKARALAQAKELMELMRRFAASPHPERRRQVKKLAGLVISEAERGEFPLEEAGTSLEEIREMRRTADDSARILAQAEPRLPKAILKAIAAVRGKPVEIEALPLVTPTRPESDPRRGYEPPAVVTVFSPPAIAFTARSEWAEQPSATEDRTARAPSNGRQEPLDETALAELTAVIDRLARA